MTKQEAIKQAQAAVNAAYAAVAKLEMYGFYDKAYQANRAYQDIIDYNKEDLEAQGDAAN